MAGRARTQLYIGILTGPHTDKEGTRYQTYAQGKFSLRPAGLPAVDHNYPWIDLSLYGDGGYFAAHSVG